MYNNYDYVGSFWDRYSFLFNLYPELFVLLGVIILICILLIFSNTKDTQPTQNNTKMIKTPIQADEKNILCPKCNTKNNILNPCCKKCLYPLKNR